MVESWKPDPVVLWNLKYIAESPDFLHEFKRYFDSSSEIAEAFVYRIVSNHLDTSPTETQHYVTELMEHLVAEPNLMEGLDEGF